MTNPIVGVLALQGDFAEHIAMLRSIGVGAVEIRLPAQLAHIDALIIPGGESPTITRLLDIYELREPIRRLGLEGWPMSSHRHRRRGSHFVLPALRGNARSGRHWGFHRGFLSAGPMGELHVRADYSP